MSINLKQAFAEKGINVIYEGRHGKMLPVTDVVLDEYKAKDGAKTGKELVAGDLVISYRSGDGKNRGAVLDPLAENDLEIILPKSNGDDLTVSGRDMSQAVVDLARLHKDDKAERARIAEENENAKKEHDLKIARHEIPADAEFEPREAGLKEGAFDKLDVLVNCIKARLTAEYRNDFTGIVGKSYAALTELKVGEATRNKLTDDELKKAIEARKLIREIDKLRHGEALEDQGPGEDFDPEDSAERISDVLSDLPVTGHAMSGAEMEARIPNAELVNLAFKPLTTTSPHSLNSKLLGSRDVNTVLQDLRRFENKDWGPRAIANTRELLRDRMPGYDFNAKIFTRDGVDLMLVADHAGSMLFAWDSKTRVLDYDPDDHIVNFTAADVPTDERLEELRAELNELRFNALDDIDFGLDEDEELVEIAPGM